MRASWTVAIVVAGIALIFASRLSAFAADDAEPPRVTLLGSLAEWMYPEATMPHGATMSDGNYAAAMSVHCHAVLETKDDFAKVIAFYEKALAAPEADATAGDAAEDGPRGHAQSVATVDDSEGRPVKVRVITETRPRVSTTLVISQGAGEEVTHIAWSQHREFESGR
jgi:hypothetical protein